MENLGIHQSSSVSVFSYAENLSTDLKTTNMVMNFHKLHLDCKVFFFFQSCMDTYLRQRGCGYVHVTPCRHRQQWRNVWPAPVALGTVSRGWAPPSSRILPPRGLVCQMAGRIMGALRYAGLAFSVCECTPCFCRKSIYSNTPTPWDV